jgi:hypothetical protein
MRTSWDNGVGNLAVYTRHYVLLGTTLPFGQRGGIYRLNILRRKRLRSRTALNAVKLAYSPVYPGAEGRR